MAWEQAHAIAHMILEDADTSDDGEVAGSEGGLSYIESADLRSPHRTSHLAPPCI